jgi:hypothetical protein
VRQLVIVAIGFVVALIVLIVINAPDPYGGPIEPDDDHRSD